MSVKINYSKKKNGKKPANLVLFSNDKFEINILKNIFLILSILILVTY